MQIDCEKRVVRLNARELASFRVRSKGGYTDFSLWRAAIGQKWHKVAEERSLQEAPHTQFEVPLFARWIQSNWTFEISGRVDQLISDKEKVLIREVKTVRRALPSSKEELLDSHLEYFIQASVYHNLLRLTNGYTNSFVETEVQFINIDNGAIQNVTLGAEEHALFEQQLDSLLPFLRGRLSAYERLETFEFSPAFSELRAGQSEFADSLELAAERSQTVLAQAPTGFGKTGIILEHALRSMKNGLIQRCLFLSTKSTGQIETIRQLNSMVRGGLHYIQMQNRAEHESESASVAQSEFIEDTLDVGRLEFETDLNVADLFEDATVSLERAKSIGADTGICPYELTKACLPFAEFWIGDLNYVFSPDSKHVFADAYSFEPERTLLIVDEAHNLPSRVADTLSCALSSSKLLFAIEELRESGAPRKLLAVASELSRWIEAQSPGQPIDPNRFYELQDLCEDLADHLNQASFDYENTPPFALETIWMVPKILKTLQVDSEQYLHWTPEPGVFSAACLDASKWIQSSISPFGSAILMSATLDPFSHFIRGCGLDPEAVSIAHGEANWRDNAYDIAIDCRVDTRLRHRKSHYQDTALSISDLCNRSVRGPIVVFFSSYQYAHNVSEYLGVLSPHLRVQIQPKGGSLSTRQDFIEQALISNDAIFLILGSSFSEAIDALGGRIEFLMIVGPALPEMNLIQQEKMDRSALGSRENAFRDVCIRPAMQRIHQALGRFVRAPGHRARVLLHCKRFAQHDYFSELLPEYQTDRQIHSSEQLIDWISESPFSMTFERKS